MRAASSLPTVFEGKAVNMRYAPSTCTWAIVMGAEPSARTASEIRPGVKVTASTEISSTGGAEAVSWSRGRPISTTDRIATRHKAGKASHNQRISVCNPRCAVIVRSNSALMRRSLRKSSSSRAPRTRIGVRGTCTDQAHGPRSRFPGCRAGLGTA